MAREWWRSKTLWTATAPALLAALGGWAQGQLTWWQALAVAAGGFGAFGIRDAQVRHEQGEALRHEERMRAVSQAGAAQRHREVAAGGAGEVLTMHDLAQHVLGLLAQDLGRMMDQRVLGLAAQAGVPVGPLGPLPGEPAARETGPAVVDREAFLRPEVGVAPSEADEADGEVE